MVSNLAVPPIALKRIADTSPRLTARILGVLYFVLVSTGIFAQFFVSGKLVIPGDAAATAANILAHKDLFQLGFAVYLIESACNIAMTALLYGLLKPVNRNVALLAAFFNLTGIAIKTISRLFFIAPLLVLGGAPYLGVFNPQQLQALALLFLRVNDQGAGTSLFFAGFYTFLNGCLVVRSTFLPRVLGVISIVGGLGWLTFLYPPLSDALFPFIVAVGVLGTLVYGVWFLLFGVNEQRWIEQAGGR